LSVYADSSFIVSLYVTDVHSVHSRARVLSAPNLWFTPLHRAEWTHAITQLQFRGRLDITEAVEMHRQLDDDKARGFWLQMALPEHALEMCATLALRHGPILGVRTLDSLHVACALELKAERFWTFDERQAKLARAEGLKT
jgi:predicted nucleic acid-binding protein